MLSEFSINFVDLVIMASLLISGLLALSRGFVKEVLFIAGLVLAAFAALTWFPSVQLFLEHYIGQALIAGSIAFVVIFVSVLTAASYLSSAISRRVRGSEIGILDRSLGFLFGLARGALVIALAYLLLVQFYPALLQEKELRTARAMPAVEYSARLLARLLPKHIGESLDKIGELSRMGAQNFESSLDNAIKAGKAAEKLKDVTMGTDKHGDSGYTRGSREDMNRLIQNRTDN